jgi:hypothetical protein
LTTHREIIAALKEDIRKLQAAVAILEGGSNELPKPSIENPQPRRRKMSAAARKRISEASKRRWAKFRAGQKKAKA